MKNAKFIYILRSDDFSFDKVYSIFRGILLLYASKRIIFITCQLVVLAESRNCKGTLQYVLKCRMPSLSTFCFLVPFLSTKSVFRGILFLHAGKGNFY